MNLPQKTPIPRITRHIGVAERYMIIVGHVLWALANGLVILTANTLLSFLQNVGEYCAAVEEAPFDVNDGISSHNDAFTEQFSKKGEEDKPADHPDDTPPDPTATA